MKTIHATRQKLELKAATLIAKKIRFLLKSQPLVALAIPGGTSVSGIFQHLLQQKIQWQKVHIFMVDERLVPTNHPDSNFQLAKSVFLDYLTENYLLPKANTHPYIYYNLPIHQAENAYKNELREISHRFDIILLSAGEDGHVGALYPNHPTINSSEEFFITTFHSPKPPPKRITASRKLMQNAKTAILLFLGDNKRHAYKNFLDRSLSVQDCPAKLIKAIDDSYVFTDLKL
jgi:6-phosphogluconolactonase